MSSGVGNGLVVVGSGPAGLAAARAFRERDDRPVLMITEDPELPYMRPALTKDFLQGDSELDDLWLIDDDSLLQLRIEVRHRTSVRDVDPARQIVVTGDGSLLPYEELVLATGSQPVPLPVPGGDHPDLIHVRDLASGHRLRELAGRQDRHVVVLGSGFIGCEAAASLARRGLDVTLVSQEEVPHASRLGDPAGRQILAWLRDAGVTMLLGSAVTRIEATGDGFSVHRGDAPTVLAGAVVVGAGARADLSVAEAAGARTERGGVVVDTSMRTTVPHVFAVGDLAYAHHTAAGRRLRVEHWGDAETHGEIAGATAAGSPQSWHTPPGFWSTIGDRTLKYSAWGDGHDEAVFTGDPDRWTVWFRAGDELCGVLTHEDDEAYERGQQLLERRARFDSVTAAGARPGSPRS